MSETVSRAAAGKHNNPNISLSLSLSRSYVILRSLMHSWCTFPVQDLYPYRKWHQRDRAAHVRRHSQVSVADPTERERPRQPKSDKADRVDKSDKVPGWLATLRLHASFDGLDRPGVGLAMFQNVTVLSNLKESRHVVYQAVYNNQPVALKKYMLTPRDSDTHRATGSTGLAYSSTSSHPHPGLGFPSAHAHATVRGDVANNIGTNTDTSPQKKHMGGSAGSAGSAISSKQRRKRREREDGSYMRFLREVRLLKRSSASV